MIQSREFMKQAILATYNDKVRSRQLARIANTYLSFQTIEINQFFISSNDVIKIFILCSC